MSDDFQGTPPAPQVPPMAAPEGDRPGPANDTSKLLAALGYIVGIVALIAILIDPYKEEKFVKFHAIQALALWVVGIILSIVSVIPIIGWLISFVGWIVVAVFAIIAAVKAFQGEYYEMPVVYNFVKQYM